jgi:hypothetical protein
MLQFKSSSEKMFYWLQDAKTDQDQSIIQQVNALIQEQEEDEDTSMEGVEQLGELNVQGLVL